MALCLNRLKSDIKYLLQVFPKSHPLFRVASATVDEITCLFVHQGRQYMVNANITETYPVDPPVWFSESDCIAETVAMLGTTTGADNHVSLVWFGISGQTFNAICAPRLYAK